MTSAPASESDIVAAATAYYSKQMEALQVARETGDPCTVLTNTASVETRNGNLQDSATVRINGNCATPVAALPTQTREMRSTLRFS
jgi:Flp pilus assembly protein TadG